MKTCSSEKRKLADDILEDANYASFREELENLGRAEFRRVHRPVLRLWLPLAATIALLAGVLFRPSKPSLHEQPATAKPGPILAVVRSSPLSLTETVRSTADRALLVNTRPPADGEVVRTGSLGTINQLTDSELLAFLAERSAGCSF